MSDTPRTDAKAFFVWHGSADSQPMHVVRVDDARDLERELARAMRVVEAAKESVNSGLLSDHDAVVRAYWEWEAGR